MAEYRLKMTPTYRVEQLAISQNDVGREIPIYLVGANREAFIIPDGSTVQLVGTKPSGLGFTVTGTWSGSTVVFAVTAEMSDEAGHIPCEVRVTNGGTIIGSSNADLYVEMNPHPSDVTDGTAEHVVDTITALVVRAETAEAGASASATSAAQSAQDAAAALAEFTEITVTVSTLPAGSQATASYENGVLALGIPRGDQGIQGEQGIQGVRGEQGIQGIQGERGEQGIQGERGETGATGATGAQGVGISTIALNSDYTLTITLTDGSSYTTGSIRGAQGEQGVQGIQGEQGVQGQAATIAVGTVTSGQSASVTNSGTSSAAVFDFVLPVYQLTAADKASIVADVLAEFDDAETIGM